MSIHNDVEFKVALGALDLAAQRRAAGRFTARVLELCGDARVHAAVEAAQQADLSEQMREPLLQAVNTARVESFTQCGRDADWSAQAGHFVARAAVSCVKAASAGESLAWDAAMHARMARTCQSVARGEGTQTREAEAQYAILEALLKA